MPDSLNEHGSAGSMSIDPTLADNQRTEPVNDLEMGPLKPGYPTISDTAFIEYLKDTFKQVYGDTEPVRGVLDDPKMMIDQLASGVRVYRHLVSRGTSKLAARFESAMATAPGINPAWVQNGVIQFAVETLRKVMESE